MWFVLSTFFKHNSFTFSTNASAHISKHLLKRHPLRSNLQTVQFSSSKIGELVDIDNELLEADEEYDLLANRYFGRSSLHNCFIIHPFVKWGPQKVHNASPESQLQEAVALIRTLAPWRVHDVVAVPLPNLDKKLLFGSGNLEKLKNLIRGDNSITAIFMNVGMLKNIQLQELQREFGLPIFDRYNIVMQILRLHAISVHAKLQVALAELPYLKSRIRKDDFSLVTSEDFETRKLMLQNREQKLKAAIKKLRSQRQVLRNRRKELNYPVVAVVGYTNCGKTSLIKALTGDEKLAPRNKLFATLDVTVHAGQLPSTLEVLYVDTVGFISDIPTTLIECFVATLEDAMFADVIVHVEDLANENHVYQREHVLTTLKNLADKTGAHELLNKIITVGNKYDLVPDYQQPEDYLTVSAKTNLGIEIFKKRLEKAVLAATERRSVTMKVPSGGEEMRWLYKNATVMKVCADSKSSEHQLMTVIMTEAKFNQFQHYFVKHRR